MTDRASEKCPVAIIGMSCRFPGASSLDELWSMLIEGRDAFRPLDERWKETLIHARKSELRPPVPRAGLLDSIDGFDAAFFGISPREAERMDPQQRFLLEVTWEAFENAGIPPERYAGQRVGVFVGSSSSDYWSVTTDSANRAALDAWTGLGGSPSILANRISYLFDFRGPSVAIDSACSASLNAVHMAKESLRSGESVIAVASGVGLLIRPENTLSFARARMLSPTSESRPFGQDVNGYVRGEGCGCVVLKRLEDALRDGDPILAVVRGSATSQDGRSAGITVPTATGQAQMLELAYADAGVDPADVAYVEAHGTGTPTGDPIEAQALGEIVGKGRPVDRPCVIGSIKSNIGHLEGGAGIAGLIKATLCLQHDRIPPTLSWQRPNAEIPFEALRLRIADRVEPLRRDGSAALVGVSAFGFGGTNVHIVLEEGPEREGSRGEDAQQPRPHLVALTARDEKAVRDLASRLAESLTEPASSAVRDVAHTLAVRRSWHGQRVAVVATTAVELGEQLRGIASGTAPVTRVAESPSSVAFVFTGMGPQWWGMARELIRTEPVFRAGIERVDRAFQELSGWSLAARAFFADKDAVPSLVDQADLGHPAHFAVQYALCELLRDWGVVPAAVVGHSAGEVSAACASGVLSFEDSIRVLYHRSRLVQTCAGLGNMLAVGLSRDAAQERVARHGGQVCVGAVNGPQSVALSGPRALLDEIAAQLEAEGRFARIIPGSFPYHSPVFDRIGEDLAKALEHIEVREGGVRAVSTVTGSWAQGDDFGAGYWARNVRERVEFDAAIRTLSRSGLRTFVEIGAHPALLGSIREILQQESGGHVLGTLRRDTEQHRAILQAAGELWSHGHPCRLDALNGGEGGLTSLPTYPWQHGSYWVEAPAEVHTDADQHPVRGARVAAGQPTWQARVLDVHPEWAADHRIHSQILLPAVSWVEAWLSAALDEGSPLPVSLAEIRFSEVRPLTETATWLRIRRSGERFTLESAASPAASDWTLHGSAQRAAEHAGCERLDLETERAQLTPVAPEYERLAQLGYGYGPRFRSVAQCWIGPDRALGRLHLDESESGAGLYALHPALFDGALHLMLWLADPRDGMYLPVGVERVTVHRRHQPGSAVWAQAKLLDSAPGEMRADVTIVDVEGAPLIAVQGVRAQRVGRSRILQASVLHRETWARVDATVEARVAPAAAAVSVEALLGAAPTQQSQTAAHALLDELAGAYFSEALTALELAPAQGWSEAVAEGLVLGSIVRTQAKLARHLARILPRTQRSSASICRELTLAHPAWHLERQLVERFGSQMAKLLAGDADPRELLLSSAHGLGGVFYTDSETCRPAHLLLRAALERESRAHGGRPLRILEVGAGTGGASAWLLPLLDPDRTEYVFTDLSNATLAEARERFPQPFVRTALLDIEKDPTAQGFAEHHFDVVIASSVLHATRDLRETLHHCRKVLQDSGVLLLSELVNPVGWIDFVFGTFDGWWRAVDSTLRPEHPLIAAEHWQALLHEAGFAETASVDAAPGAAFAVLAARADRSSVATVAAEPLPDGQSWWLVGGGEVLDSIEARLRRAGCDVVTSRDARSLNRPASSFERVVFSESARLDAVGVESLLDLAHALEGSTQLTVVTRGAQRMSVDRAMRHPRQAALWGFARVLGAERPDLALRLIDLGEELSIRDGDDVLRELARGEGEGEDEIALRGALRFAPRVTQPGVEDLETLRTSAPGDAWHAALAYAGDLDSLVFRRSARPAPAAGEIEVEVEVHGLNRQETSEPGVEVRADCAGVICRVGLGVDELAVGDRVVGIAPAALGSHVTAPAALFARIPEGMSACEAVTLASAGAAMELALCEFGRLRAGETVLVDAASSDTGLVAIAIATQLGARVLAMEESSERRAWLATLGVDRVLDPNAASFRAQTLEASQGRGVDLVLSSLGGEGMTAGLGLLRPGGRLIELGSRNVSRDCPVGLRSLAQNRSVHVVDLEDLASERPDRAGELLRALFERVRAGAVRALPHVRMPIDRIHEALRIVVARKHPGKVVLESRVARLPLRSPAGTTLGLRPDATYLVVGGVGGFGLATAAWLVRRGARQIALMGRSGALHGPEAEQQVADLRAQGAQIAVHKGDVSSRADVARVLEAIAASPNPLKGVFHAAMVLDDVPVADMSRERLEKVFTPKAMGAWELHLATRELELDHFVLFSSFSRLIGMPGQANYVAANEYLAALADLRRTLGKPATCVDWGIIGDVGYMARNQRISNRLMDAGVSPLQAEEALEVLDHILSAGADGVGVARIDWGRLDQLLSMARLPARFAQLGAAAASAASGPGSEAPGLEALRAAPSAEEREAAALAFVAARAASILRCSAESLPTDQALVRVGFDSLMEVELRALIQRDAGVEMPSLRATRGASLRVLARRVLEQLGYGAEAAPRASEVSAEFLRWIDAREQRLSQAFRDASPDEVQRALRETMDELTPHVADLDEDQHRAYRAAFYPRLAHFFLEGEMLRRAHDKPLGYAGDYLLMKHIYENRPAGEGVQAAVDTFALDLSGSQAVRNRAPYLHGLLERTVRDRDSVRVVSIGCGPAWEIRQLSTDEPEWAERIDLLLVDQDEGALADCKAALHDNASTRSVDYLCLPVDKLAGDGSYEQDRIGTPDLIYSTGLFDYFAKQTFARYLQALYDRVAPGGRLVVGNLATSHTSRWLIEYACDWFVYHRTADELAELGAALEPRPTSVGVEAEAIGVNLFLVVDRPE